MFLDKTSDLTLTVSLLSQVNKWVPLNLMLRVSFNGQASHPGGGGGGKNLVTALNKLGHKTQTEI